MPCRRCSECAGMTHHWVENEDSGVDFDDPDSAEAEARGAPDHAYACKHCPALGDECPECVGSGEEIDQEGNGFICRRCRGEGVILADASAHAEDAY